MAGLDLVTRYRLRLTDRADSRLGPLTGEYALGAAMWTGPRSAFVGFYVPPAVDALGDLERRLRNAEAWCAERLRVQGSQRCDVLLVALGPIAGKVTTTASGPIRVGAASVDPATGAVEVHTSLPGGLPGVGELRGYVRTATDPARVPTLAAVDLAERQMVAGGYVAPTRRAMTSTPYATYTLIGIFLAVFGIELAVVGHIRGDFPVTTVDMGALIYHSTGTLGGQFDAQAALLRPGSSPDWWRFVSAAFLHDRTNYLHVLSNCYAMYVIGSFVERLYGRVVLVGAFLITAIGGNIISALVESASVNSPVYSLGASGGVFGLLGLLFMLGRARGANVPAGLAHSVRQYVIGIALLNGVLTFVIPHVNWVAHAGGFGVGVLVGAFLPPSPEVGGRRLTGAEQAVVGAVCLVSLVALGFAGAHLADVLSMPSGPDFPSGVPLL